MDKFTIIEKLSCMHAVSGYEHRISDQIAKMFSVYCHDVRIDNLGSVVGTMYSKNPQAKTIMLEAHMDEIGFMVTNIDDNGFVEFTNIGGIDPRILPAKEVVIHGREDIIGIIGAKPPHIVTEAQRGQAVSMDSLRIDTMYSGARLREIVSVGDTITFCDSYTRLGDKYISAKSQDDRTSLATLIFVMDSVKELTLPFNLCFCACVQEEVGRRGAGALATQINPIMAIAIDVCHATTPDASKDTFMSGSGTVISKGPNIHPSLSKYAVRIMEENNIPYNIDIDGGDTGTDAWAIQTSNMGIPTMLFSLPLKYMHTMVETVNIDDVCHTADAISALIVSIKDVEEILCCDF